MPIWPCSLFLNWPQQSLKKIDRLLKSAYIFIFCKQSQLWAGHWSSPCAAQYDRSCSGVTAVLSAEQAPSVFTNKTSGSWVSMKKIPNANLFLFILYVTLLVVWLHYDNPDWGSGSSQLFLFKHVTDWDIRLCFASAVPGPWLRYSEALGSRWPSSHQLWSLTRY